MTAWLVTVCDGEAGGEYGPSCVVEAASAVEAAHVGVKKLADEERGASGAYGIECQQCENIAVDQVTVFDMSTGKSFTQHTMWGAADG